MHVPAANFNSLLGGVVVVLGQLRSDPGNIKWRYRSPATMPPVAKSRDAERHGKDRKPSYPPFFLPRESMENSRKSAGKMGRNFMFGHAILARIGRAIAQVMKGMGENEK